LETRVERDGDTKTTISVNGGPEVPLNSPEAVEQITKAGRDVLKAARRRQQPPAAPPA
jgi:hypothetical protein